MGDVDSPCFRNLHSTTLLLSQESPTRDCFLCNSLLDGSIISLHYPARVATSGSPHTQTHVAPSVSPNTSAVSLGYLLSSECSHESSAPLLGPQVPCNAGVSIHDLYLVDAPIVQES